MDERGSQRELGEEGNDSLPMICHSRRCGGDVGGNSSLPKWEEKLETGRELRQNQSQRRIARIFVVSRYRGRRDFASGHCDILMRSGGERQGKDGEEQTDCEAFHDE